jgi:hypothetical protein
MLISSVQFYDVVLFFHIAAVVLAFGPTFAYPMFIQIAERTDPRALPVIGRGIHTWDRIGNVLLLIILVAGIYLASDRWDFSDFYVTWGFVAVILIGGLTGAYFMPRSKKIVELAERDIAASGDGPVELSAEYQALSKQLGQVGMFAGLVVILTIYVMTAKPFL